MPPHSTVYAVALATPVPPPATTSPVQLASDPLAGVPSAPPEYRIVAAASGKVYTLAVVGPAAVKYAIPVPPLAVASIVDSPAAVPVVF